MLVITNYQHITIILCILSYYHHIIIISSYHHHYYWLILTTAGLCFFYHIFFQMWQRQREHLVDALVVFAVAVLQCLVSADMKLLCVLSSAGIRGLSCAMNLARAWIKFQSR